MKCPKCGYLGFEQTERCRNCGYEFSLAQPAALLELSIRTDESSDFERGVELPLFGASLSDDEPLISRPSPPRPPLAVRRATPEVPRVRTVAPRPGILDLAPDDDGFPEATPPILETPPTDRSAPLVARLAAVAIDFVVLAAIDLLVIYFTMQICGIALNEFDVLPKWPLGAFLLALNGGYLVAFTAGGQTLGKMAVGIKVVPDESQSSIDIGRAFAREFMWVLLAVPAGLGFLSVFGAGHRGFHDRFARTRVIR